MAIAEAYHALHHHYGVPETEARELLRRFVSSGVVRLEPETSHRSRRAVAQGL